MPVTSAAVKNRPTEYEVDHRSDPLLQSLKTDLPALEKLHEQAGSSWGFEHPSYRFYHQSFKVFGLQDLAKRTVGGPRRHNEGTGLSPSFLGIVAQGTGRSFGLETDHDWTNNTRPILEAVFHAKTFLSLALHCANSLDRAPRIMPSGWGAVFYLYNVR